MVQADPNFRADPARGVYITEPLTAALVSKVGPKILDLRSDKLKPITVFINSPGGDIRVLDILDGLLRSRDADGRRSRIITVAIGDANSAAATLLTLGDYAIAYQHSRMHFHGTRLPIVEELTAEVASESAGWLTGHNRAIAMKLARKVMERLVFHYVALRPEFPDAQKRLKRSVLNPMECFADCLKKRTSRSGDNLLSGSIRHNIRLKEIFTSITKAKLKPSDSEVVTEAKILRALLDFEIREHKRDAWRLDEFGMQDLWADYFLLRDYLFGEHVSHLDLAVERYGPSFLNAEQFTEFSSRQKEDPKAARVWLKPLIKSDVQEFWYFAVCLCRLMQQGENSLGAADAYWLGVVDEVVGTDMIGTRHLIEQEVTSGQSAPS